MMRVFAVLALAFAFVIGLTVANPTKVQAVCGPSVETPRIVRVLDGADKTGDVIANLVDGVDVVDVFRFVYHMVAMTHTVTETVRASASRTDEPAAAEAWRLRAAEDQQTALLGCCAQQVDRQPSPPGTLPPPPSTDDEWDPKMASIGQVPLDCTPVMCAPPGGTVRAASLQRNTDGTVPFSKRQKAIALTAIDEARKAGLTGADLERAVVINLMTGWAESGLRNLNYGDGSSVGYLQLIAMHGTAEQRRDPAFSARWFYREMQSPIVKSRMGKPWNRLSLNDAAQGTQWSATPNVYGQYEGRARRLLAAVGGVGAAPTPPSGGADCIEKPGKAAPAPVVGGGSARITPAGVSSRSAVAAAKVIGPRFGYKTIGTYHGHQPTRARALDFMTSTKTQGDATAAYIRANMRALNVEYVIWNRRMLRAYDKPGIPAGTWAPYFDGGSSNPNRAHTNHVHVSFYPDRLAGSAQA